MSIPYFLLISFNVGTKVSAINAGLIFGNSFTNFSNISTLSDFAINFAKSEETPCLMNFFTLSSINSGSLILEVSTFNGTAIGNTTLTNLNRFRITFGYLGVGDIVIEAKPNNESRDYEILHVFETDGALTTTHIGNPIVPVRFEVENTGNTTDIIMQSGSWNAKAWTNNPGAGARPQHSNGVTLIGNTDVETGFVAFRSAELFNTKTNKILSELLISNFTSDLEGLAKITIVRNPTVTGGTWNPVDAGNGVLEENNTFTSYTGGEDVFVQFIGAGSASKIQDTGSISFVDLGVFAKPGDSFLITAERLAGTTAYTMYWSLNWRDLF